MTSWTSFSSAAPELSSAIRARFEAHLHHVVATLRADGTPRVSGTEARFFGDELYLGCMPGSRKGADLTRNGHYALHAATVDVELQDGDAKVSGVARRCDPDEATAFLRSLGNDQVLDGEVYAAGISEATLTRVDGDHLVIDTWSEAGGVRRIERT